MREEEVEEKEDEKEEEEKEELWIGNVLNTFVEFMRLKSQEGTEDFQSLRSRFQKNLEDNKVQVKPRPPGLKPVIPAKPNVRVASNKYFQKPLPKVASSPELPILPSKDRDRTPVNISNLNQSFTFRSSSRIQQESAEETFKENVGNKPTIQEPKPVLPRPSTNLAVRKNVANIPPKPPLFNKPTIGKCTNIPKLKLLPSEAVLGPKPRKPSRPPFVDLDKFRKSEDSGDYVVMRGCPDILKHFTPKLSASQSQPNLVTRSPSHYIRRSTGCCTETLLPKYISLIEGKHKAELPVCRVDDNQPDGLGYKKISKTLKLSCSTVDKTIRWFQRRGSTQNRPHHGRPKKLNASVQRHIQKLCLENRHELYDDVDSILEKSKPLSRDLSSSSESNILITNWRNDTNLKKIEKQEREFRKKFQFNGEIKVISRTMVDPNAVIQKAGDKDLSYIRGEILDVIQLTSAEKILCRNCEGKFGYVPRKAVLKLEKTIYDNIDSAELSIKILCYVCFCIVDEIYDDAELISNTFPAVPTKARFQHSYVTRMFHRNPSQTRAKTKLELQQEKENLKIRKNEEKEAKELKKKFKFEGEIRVLTRMMVVPSAGNKRGGGKELPISKGEILEVIQFTNEEKLLCRNSKRKYGYVKRRYVLQIEKDIYDDVDNLRCGIANLRS
ncbi:FYN-binding protein 1-like [Rhinophrynus dorsalis]